MADAYINFGNFLLLKQVSQDGMGTLWRAGEMERSGFKRIVWLRRFDQAGLDRAAVGAEASAVNQLAQVLKASSVVRNQSCGRERGVPYIAWDHVPAQPLDQLLARVAAEQFPIAIDNALLIAEKIAAGLAAGLAVEVGGAPLVHGFLVPHMVMIGNDGEAMIAGFGLSRGLLANLDRVAIQEVATPYLAPEVLTSGQTSKRADVYSTGALLYHILCGHPLPADPAERFAALAAPRLAFEEGAVPQDVLAVLQKSLAERPDDRHGSAGEFKKDLEKLLYGGAYSPTTFNLALFIDRLYRNDIEQEDQELQREKNLDVAMYFKAPEEEVRVAPAAPAANKWLIPAIAGGVVVIAIGGFFALRPSGPSAEEQRRTMNEMVKSLVADELAKRETQIKKELEAEKVKTEEFRRQVEEQKKAQAGGRQFTAEEKLRAEQLQRDLTAREAAQRKKEQELADVQQKKLAEQTRAQQAASRQAAVSPTLAPTVPAVIPTQAPAAAPAVAMAQPTAVPAPPTAAPAVEVGGPAAAVPGSLGAAAREGDFIDPTLVDSAPQVLVETKLQTPRAAVMAKRRDSGLVILKATVNERGTVDSVEVLRGFKVAGLGIDEACVAAVKGYRFKPAIKDGVKVKTTTTITVPVDLSKSR